MPFLYKPLKATDDPIWLWPSGKPKAMKSLILLDEIQALSHRAHTTFPKSDSVQNTGFLFSDAALVFCWLFWFLFSSWDWFFIPLHVSSLQKCHFNGWVCSSRIPDLLPCQRQQPFGPCHVGLCLTNMQQPFEAGQRHVGNCHALTGNECNYLGNINSTAQDSRFSGATMCSPAMGGSQACTMALLTAKITYK